MTWYIFIANNRNFVFTHKQRTGEMISGLKEQPSFTLHLGTAEKKAARGWLWSRLYDRWSIQPFPMLNPIVLLQSSTSLISEIF